MKIAIASLALLAFAHPAADRLEFGPEEGLEIEKRFEAHFQLEKKSMTMSIGDQELPAELTEDTVLDMESRKTIVVRDEYKKVAGGRPRELVRRYDTLSHVEHQEALMPGMPEAKVEDKEKESDLVGKSVLFRWDEEEGSHAKEWVGDGAEDALLDGLEEDMDLRRILPAKAVSKGDTWKIDLREFGEIFGPGGDLGLSKGDSDDSQFEDNLTGDATCTYRGTEAIEGRELARIRVDCKARSFVEQEEDDDTPRMRMDIVVELEGDVLWDVKANCLASYELDGEMSADMRITKEIEIQGEAHQLVVKVELGGRSEVAGKFTMR